MFQPLDKETYEGLKNDIKERGIETDLFVSVGTPDVEDGCILCGNTRYKIAQELEIPDDKIPYKTKTFRFREEAIEFALKDNTLRRQLNMYQKCMIMKKMEPYAREVMAIKKKVAGSEGGKIGGKLGSRDGIPNKPKVKVT